MQKRTPKKIWKRRTIMSIDTIKQCAKVLKDGVERDFQNTNLKPLQNAWRELKVLIPHVIIQWRFSVETHDKLSYVSLVREALEYACMLQIHLQDINEYEVCWRLLEPLYIDYAPPQLPSSEWRPSLYAVQLLKLLIDGERAGDFHVLLQRVSVEDLENPDIVFVMKLKQSLMSGNYNKSLEIISHPSSIRLRYLCEFLIDSVRRSVADCLTNSLVEIPFSQAKLLLNLDSDEKLRKFIVETNNRYEAASFTNSLLSNTENEFSSPCFEEKVNFGPYYKWVVEGDMIRFVRINCPLTKCIPVDEVVSYVLGYIRELERIVHENHHGNSDPLNRKEMLIRFTSKQDPHILVCALVARCLDLDITWGKVTGLPQLELRINKGESEVTVTSPYAICWYLLDYCDAQRSTNSFLSNTKRRHYAEDDLVVWIFSKLIPFLHGLNKDNVSIAICSLKKKLIGLNPMEPTLGAICLYAALRTSRHFSSLENFLEDPSPIQEFCTVLERDSRVKEVLKEFNDNLPYLSASETSYKNKRFFISTAINYTNGSPHIGHAYEALVADVIARYYKGEGSSVLFLTGTDEHGQKIAENAEKQNARPIDICDFYVSKYKKLNQLLNVDYTTFVRTSSPEHIRVAQLVWRISESHGDIYLGNYSGWYNVREEAFVSETEAKAAQYKDVVTGYPLQKMQEESFFFRMSKYKTQLISHIENNEDFIQPSHRRTEILTRLRKPLEDLSCSRTTFSWGIPVPGHPKHVMYVWFDALTNYLTGAGFKEDAMESHAWPADIHIIGKDITWFHCVIWPCLLMSIGLSLPKTVFAHGFVLAKDSAKMSKSLNNVVDPLEVLETLKNPDPFRFYLLYCGEIGRDIKFDVDAMMLAHESELADVIGNLVHRATGLCAKYCEGLVPRHDEVTGYPPFDFHEARHHLANLMRNFLLNEALTFITGLCRDANKYITDKAPWTMPLMSDRLQICRVLLETVYYLAHFLAPFIPETASKIFGRLNTPQRHLTDLSVWYNNLEPATPVEVDEVLFVKQQKSYALSTGDHGRCMGVSISKKIT